MPGRAGLINVCERKNVGFHSGALASSDQAGAGPASEFEVFCSTEFGFAAGAGGLWGPEKCKNYYYAASDKKSPVH